MDNIRISDGNDVYIPISIAEQVIDAEEINESLIKTLVGVPCIKEENYNKIILKNDEYLSKNGGFQELTRLFSFRASVESSIRFSALKSLFIGKLSEDDIIKEAIKSAKEEENLFKEFSSGKYKKQIEFIDSGEYVAKDALIKNGLDIQLISEITSSGAELFGYVVGKGIFKELCLEEDGWDELHWNEIISVNDVSIIVGREPIDTPDTIETITRETSRDFREHSVFENILWCVCNARLSHEWVDYAEIGESGIRFSLKYDVLTKLLNPLSDTTRILKEGIVNFDA